MSFKDYYQQLNSQTGIKAYVKKKLFNNLLKELVEQEKELEKQKVIIKAQEKTIEEKEQELKRQERLIHAVTRHITDTVLLREKPGLLIDVTHVTAVGNWRTGLLRPDGKIWMTGISRVVNNLFHQIYNQAENVVPVQHQSGKFITGYSYLSHMEGIEEKTDQTVSLQRGDKIFLLDDPWTEFAAFSLMLDMAADRGVKSYGIVHDLIPVQYPEVCDNETVLPKYIGWHHMLLQKADAVVCVSRTTADALIGYYEQMRFVRSRPLAVYFFHEGADIPEGVQSVREEIRRFVEGGRFTFLMVGTVEPRKGHGVVLQALQKLPDNIRKECRILIIGKDGWKNEDVHKMLALPELKETTLWVRDGSDEELRWAYNHTGALIAASLQEGFGLPLVEAAHFGLPLICSDIPVFREVTRGNADFFKVMDAEALAECLMKWMQTDRHPDSRKIPVYSWQESAREVLDILEGKIEPYKVLQ
ncbi:MAG: glycosyltransferase [Acidaminococcaceae bacterium]|nr:glycosyltransferase [Acidaminococcaceae bacterium]